MAERGAAVGRSTTCARHPNSGLMGCLSNSKASYISLLESATCCSTSWGTRASVVHTMDDYRDSRPTKCCPPTLNTFVILALVFAIAADVLFRIQHGLIAVVTNQVHQIFS